MRVCPAAGIAAVVAMGCGRIGFVDRAAGDAAGAGDGARGDGSGGNGDGSAACPFGAPVKLAALDTPTHVEDSPQLAASGLTLYYESDSLGQGNDLFVATRPARDAPFGSGAPIAELDSQDNEYDPSPTGDELELFFTIDRGTGPSIYRSERGDVTAAWSTAVQQTALGTDNVAGPYITPDGLALYYNSLTDMDGEGTLLVTQRTDRKMPFPAGVPVHGIDTGATKGYPSLTADRTELYFESGTPLQIYVARADGSGGFTAPAPIAAADDGFAGAEDPGISGDGLELVFAAALSTTQPNVDLYDATRACN